MRYCARSKEHKVRFERYSMPTYAVGDLWRDVEAIQKVWVMPMHCSDLGETPKYFRLISEMEEEV